MTIKNKKTEEKEKLEKGSLEKGSIVIIGASFGDRYIEMHTAATQNDVKIYDKDGNQLYIKNLKEKVESFFIEELKSIHAVELPIKDNKLIVVSYCSVQDKIRLLPKLIVHPAYALYHGIIGLDGIMDDDRFLPIDEYKNKLKINNIAEFHHADMYNDILEGIVKLIETRSIDTFKSLAEIIVEEEEKTKKAVEAIRNFPIRYTTDFVKLGETLKQIGDRSSTFRDYLEKLEREGGNDYIIGFIFLGYGDIDRAEYYAEKTDSSFNKRLLKDEIKKKKLNNN